MPSASQRSRVRMFRPSSAASSSFVKNCDRIGSEFDMPNTFALISARSNHIQGNLRTGGFHEFRGRIFPPEVQRRLSIRLQEVGRRLFSDTQVFADIGRSVRADLEILGIIRSEKKCQFVDATYEPACSRT